MSPGAARLDASASTQAPGAVPVPRPRQKRNQVVRACDWCRQHRTKCDNGVPCTNCRSKGAQCSNDAVKATSLPHAYREIERLRKKVQDLELELQEQRRATSSEPQSLRLASSICSPPELSTTPASTLDSGYGDAQHLWGGVYVAAARSRKKTWYGPSSLFYFIGRFAGCLNSDLQRAHTSDHMLDLNPPSLLLDEPAKASDQTGTAAGTARSEYLSLSQEEYFLDLYWQSYHTGLFAILDEEDFKGYYRSLWKKDGSQREPSPLVDMVLALCIQSGASKEIDATVVGNLYYRRCQRLLAYESENPTIATVQCHLLCCTYLCCGTFQNMMDIACAQAARAAYMLGLHLDPPETLPLRDREMRKRLWWTLYTLDSKICMKLGRPFLVYPSRSSPSLPGDGFEVAMQSGSTFAPLGEGVTWLSFNLHQAKLFQVTRNIHTAFYSNHVPVDDGHTIWDDAGALESQANFLKGHVAGLDQWRREVPSALTTKRRDPSSHAFATDGTQLDIEPFAPLWIQRQRLLLELTYHDLCINLHRPFISFVNTLPSSTAAVEAANKCALHAAELTGITHYVLSSTTILLPWYGAFQWQWNAAMTLLGYVLAYPHCQSSERARAAINQAVAVFDIFSRNFDLSRSASKIVRELGAKVDSVVQERQRSQSHTMADASSLLLTDMPLQDSTFVGNNLAAPGMIDESANFGDLLQMACDVEQYIDLGMLWPPAGEVYLDPWLESYESK